jgi:hypothetical protein
MKRVNITKHFLYGKLQVKFHIFSIEVIILMEKYLTGLGRAKAYIRLKHTHGTCVLCLSVRPKNIVVSLVSENVAVEM